MQWLMGCNGVEENEEGRLAHVRFISVFGKVPTRVVLIIEN